MRKILLIFSIACSFNVFAQKSNVESAAIYLRNLEMEDAKKAIDAASIHEETKNEAKTWFFYSAIYDTIYRNPSNFGNIDKDVVEKLAIGCKKCVDADTKKKYEYYCLNIAIINSAFACYNKALEYYNAKDFKNAIKYFNYVLEVIPYDKDKQIAKNNITDKLIYLTLADLAIKSKEYPEAKKNLQKLIDMDYNDHIIYLLMNEVYMQEKDTVKAFTYIEMGRKRFPSEKDLVNQELNHYITQGKQDLLLVKLNENIEQDGENQILLNLRGNVYDNMSVDIYKKAKTAKDTADKITKKSKLEKVPANKTKLDLAAKRYNTEGDTLMKQWKTCMTKAEADYKKVIDINPENIDAFTSLGGLINNKTTEIADRMNSIKAATQAEYDKKFGEMKKVQDSVLNVALGYFNKSLELINALPDDNDVKKAEKKAYIKTVLYNMQVIYANLGDEKKTMEIMKKRKELE